MHFYSFDSSFIARFFVLSVVVEAIVLFLFRINNITKVILHSLIVNAVSLGIGYLLLLLLHGTNTIIYNPTAATFHLAILFAATVLVEGSLLLMLNKKQHKNTVWLATLVMNLASYLLFYLIFL